METARFFYELPGERVAQRPAEPRHSARLLRAADLSDWTVRDLPGLLRPGDLVVVNETRVRAARLRGRRAVTGGAVEMLLLGRIGERWEALLRPARRLRSGAELEFGPLAARLETDPHHGKAQVTLDAGGRDVEEAIAEAGEIPLPPYIRAPLEDPERYQTVFGSKVGSAAAPTAALHFTPQLLDELREGGIGVAAVELQVGLDTFRPITARRIAEHRIHSEWAEVTPAVAARIAAARSAGGRIAAIGTTVVRTLETAAADGEVRPYRGSTSLYITPGYRFRAVDILMTNFHIPGSSLLVLVAAFMGERWRALYETALARRYRFLSFGDAMLAERAPLP